MSLDLIVLHDIAQSQSRTRLRDLIVGVERLTKSGQLPWSRIHVHCNEFRALMELRPQPNTQLSLHRLNFTRSGDIPGDALKASHWVVVNLAPGTRFLEVQVTDAKQFPALAYWGDIPMFGLSTEQVRLPEDPNKFVDPFLAWFATGFERPVVAVVPAPVTKQHIVVEEVSTQLVVTEKKPAVTDTKPLVTEKKAAVTDTKPLVTEKKAAVTEKKPVVTEKKPAVTEKKPVVTEKKAAVTEVLKPKDLRGKPNPESLSSKAKPTSEPQVRQMVAGAQVFNNPYQATMGALTIRPLRRKVPVPPEEPHQEEEVIVPEPVARSRVQQLESELEASLARQKAVEAALEEELRRLRDVRPLGHPVWFTPTNATTQKVSAHEKWNVQFASSVPYKKDVELFCKLHQMSSSGLFRVPKQEFRFFCWRYLPLLRLVSLPHPPSHESTNFEAIFVEFRVLPHAEFLLRNAMLKLDERWSFTVVCGQINCDWMRALCQELSPRIRVIVLDCENLTPSTYSLLLASHDFWHLLRGEHLLIFQEDTMIFGGSRGMMDTFLQYDYVGAPWPDEQNDTPNGVGNGGLSLRSRKAMLRVVDSVSIFETSFESSTLDYMRNTRSVVPPEDVYFSLNLQIKGLGKVAPREVAAAFSSESLYNPNSWGGHGVWVEKAGAGVWKSRMIRETLMQVCPTSDKKSFYHRGGWGSVLQSLEDVDMLSEHAAVRFFDVLDAHFLWGSASVIDQPWVGCVHGVIDAPPYAQFCSIARLFDLQSFVDSLAQCRFLLVLSRTSQLFLQENLACIGRPDLPVHFLLHPVDMTNTIPFDWMKYVANDRKRLIQVGQQARKLLSIYLVNSPGHDKMWLTGTKDYVKLDTFLGKEIEMLQLNSVAQTVMSSMLEMRAFLENHEEYDELLSKNIVFLDFYDCAACNVVLECILRNTPVILKRTEGGADYLPADYPLFFDSLDEVPALLQTEKLLEAHRFLATMDKERFGLVHFVHDFANLCYREFILNPNR